MNFDEFFDAVTGGADENGPGLRNVYDHLVATGADVRAVLEGTAPELSDKAPERRIMRALAEIVRLPICDAEEVILREPVMVEVQRIKSASDEMRKDLAQAKARIAELEKRIEVLEKDGQMACIEPLPGCQCAGCLYAAERGGA